MFEDQKERHKIIAYQIGQMFEQIEQIDKVEL